jgi:predicted nuclease of predicted toxin-antitoxin system
MRRLTIAQWADEQQSRDAGWAKSARSAAERRGPPRKLKLLVDENLGADFANYVSSVSSLRGYPSPLGIADEDLWELAWQRKIPLLTGDRDFWDDQRYPLQRCPGVIVLLGSTHVSKAVALASVQHQWDLVRRIRSTPGFMMFLKLMGRENGSSGKFWDGQDVVVVE